MKNKINSEALLELIILLGVVILLTGALLSGKIRYYVHPRIDKYIWLGIIVLIVIIFFMLPQVKKPRHSAHLFPYIILLIPIMTAVMLPINSGASTDIKKNTDNLDKDNLAIEIADQENINDQNGEILIEWDGNKNKEIQGDIIIEDEEFGYWYVEIYNHMEQYEGRKITLKGQVLRVEGLAENELIPARKAMVCCAADVQPYGFICRIPDAIKWADDEWVLVTGTIHIENYEGEPMPMLEATVVEKAVPPTDEYVYFY